MATVGVKGLVFMLVESTVRRLHLL